MKKNEKDEIQKDKTNEKKNKSGTSNDTLKLWSFEKTKYFQAEVGGRPHIVRLKNTLLHWGKRPGGDSTRGPGVNAAEIAPGVSGCSMKIRSFRKILLNLDTFRSSLYFFVVFFLFFLFFVFHQARGVSAWIVPAS